LGRQGRLAQKQQPLGRGEKNNKNNRKKQEKNRKNTGTTQEQHRKKTGKQQAKKWVKNTKSSVFLVFPDFSRCLGLL
jgi:hypothetical protein